MNHTDGYAILHIKLDEIQKYTSSFDIFKQKCTLVEYEQLTGTQILQEYDVKANVAPRNLIAFIKRHVLLNATVCMDPAIGVNFTSFPMEGVNKRRC